MTRRRLAASTAMTLVFLFAAATAVLADSAAPLVVEIDWSSDTPLSGTISDGRVILDQAVGGTYPVVVVAGPPVNGNNILMTVEVVVGSMPQPGYLELWVVLPDGGRYFSRSFDATGVGVLQSGQSLTVQLPFALDGAKPSALELNAVLPAGGRVEIGLVSVFDIGAEPILIGDDAWWSQEMGGLIGGLAGGIFGVLGALIGGLASRGRARGFVTAAMGAGIALGLTAAAIGVVALIIGQPYQVWFPLLLFGTILGGVFGGLRRSVMARYESMELQKIRAYDLA